MPTQSHPTSKHFGALCRRVVDETPTSRGSLVSAHTFVRHWSARMSSAATQHELVYLWESVDVRACAHA
jgi:hypothetical protein